MSSKPELSDISLSFELLSSWQMVTLEDDEFRVAMELVRVCAAGLVWTYSPPTDGSLPDDDRKLARVARVDLRVWKRIKPKLLNIFEIRDGRWHLSMPWVSVGEIKRFGIPANIAREVVQREGKRCSYCGCTEGPFDLDHIFPVSKGGSNDPSNLTLACQSCNRSKGGKTLLEWMANR